MGECKYNLSEMIERRIRRDVEPNVSAARDAIQDAIVSLIGALGISHHDAGTFDFLDNVANTYREKLVRDCMSAAVDGMTTGKPVEDPSAASVTRTTLSMIGGDTVIIAHPSMLTTDQRNQIAERAKKSLPDGVNVLVLDAGMSVAAVVKA
ncbi:hypothetical protein HHL21_12155 [Massilia sp. RP-1-19]|uniref:Uncharacterized protein n=1 Tax=Massilia polaris TaxID=2728846 RepID=A0A848HR91_9BURK|nr:hypothetical protein [Massilia polaris]NML61813.1 hypothetical protein [Massilia polaris]